MSIFERTGQSVQSLSLSWRLSHFADRNELARWLLEQLRSDAQVNRVLFLHGMGGNGKSLLLRYLESHCCLQLGDDDWQVLGTGRLPEALTMLRERNRGTPVPRALIDFAPDALGQRRPQEALRGLFILKRQLHEYRIRTPRFDLAALTYLEKSGLAYDEILPELFPRAELDLATTLADAISGVPIVGGLKAAFDIIDRRSGHALGRWRLTRRVEQEMVDAMRNAAADPELADLLPYYFAHDVNAAVEPEARSRIVLFFDTHEAFWGEDAFPTADSISLAALARDKWLRVLIGSLDLGRVVAIVAGRRPPRWAAAEEARIPDECIELRQVGGLSWEDARWLLSQVGITNEADQTYLLDLSSGVPDEVHPYMLGLCTDLIASQPVLISGLLRERDELAADLATRRRWLVGRVMSTVGDEMQRAVVAVAAGRSFDRESFQFLGERLDFAHARADFSRLVTFSFILDVGERDGTSDVSFAVHGLLRRELREMFPERTQAAHQALLEFHSRHHDPASVAEAALHEAYLDPTAGLRRWCEAIDGYLSIGRYVDCQPFATVAAELIAAVGRPEAAVYFRVAQTHLGRGETVEAAALLDQLPARSSEAALLRADLEFYLCHLDAAERSARDGLSRATGGDAERLQLRLAEILLYRGDFVQARQVLTRNPEGTSRTLERTMLLGEVELFSGEISRARELFDRCLAEIEAVPLPRRDGTAYGWALAGTGLVHLFELRFDEAFADFERGLEAREQVLHARGIANSLLCMGMARCGAGRHEEGRDYLARAAKLTLDQGDQVTLAKVRHTEGVSQLVTGDAPAALRLIASSRDLAEANCVPYDVAHSILDLALVHEALGEHRLMVQCRERARHDLARKPFGLLRRLYPDVMTPMVGRIRSGLVAFAAGDAFGAPWEGMPPGSIFVASDSVIARREDWPVGCTTDDTDQLEATAEALTAHDDRTVAHRLLRALSERLTGMRGPGGTTPAAVHRFDSTGATEALDGSTNGAVVRALATGWAFPPGCGRERRSCCDVISRATHGAPGAMLAARIAAAVASWALEVSDSATLTEVAVEELDVSCAELEIDPQDAELIRQAARGSFRPSEAGISMEAVETIAAVVSVVREAQDIATATVTAIRLGGDTDTVAAIVAGILGCREADEAERLPWLGSVLLSDPRIIDRLAMGLATARLAQYG